MPFLSSFLQFILSFLQFITLVLNTPTICALNDFKLKLPFLVVVVLLLLITVILMLYQSRRSRSEWNVLIVEVLVLVFMKPWLVEALPQA